MGVSIAVRAIRINTRSGDALTSRERQSPPRVAGLCPSGNPGGLSLCLQVHGRESLRRHSACESAVHMRFPDAVAGLIGIPGAAEIPERRALPAHQTCSS